ncbi:Tripartite-type tricarboxylate transporter, receptor component TctC [Mesorhizobium albiziae]|uniref:Tripartite-type tricarboxylate transporter, receptor component TctC n=1 Tax=Neomesorhizobium albiziae TaxID=335020 RepID=A0A1I4BG54_9HYPH|nr:tripartite tricarboxylate transporter substrate binding protein [Mesorhizobium albiziae]GLS29867.1 MFS transporter [Mesorhizobium albiziae]SFK67754.1 Tripartite-type tricarboxylate transporter, receptor component TctC [Mesorhizobium albiziae]
MRNWTNYQTRRAFMTLAAVAAVVAVGTPRTLAQTYPERQITVIVPFAAGGTTDIFARLVGQSLSQQFGQPVVIENRGGAGGNIGTEAVAKAAPDGYTLLVGTVGTHAINQSLYKNMAFDPQKDFQPLSRIANVPNVLEVNPERPYKTVKELIDHAKAHPNEVTFASSGTGTSIHMAGELFKKMAGVDMEHVVYKGSAPALVDLLGNQVAIMFDNVPSSIQHLKSGKLRALAVTSKKRSMALPDVPTIDESGLPGFEATSWFGVFAPADTAPDVVAKLNEAIVKALNEPTINQKIVDIGGEPNPETPEEFAAFIKAEAVKWADVVKASGASLD